MLSTYKDLRIGRIYWHEGSKYIYLGKCSIKDESGSFDMYVAIPEAHVSGRIDNANPKAIYRNLKENLMLGQQTNDNDVVIGNSITVNEIEYVIKAA